jgi:hypothetical protein
MRTGTRQTGRLFRWRCSPNAYRHGLTIFAASSFVLLAALVRPSVADSGATRPAVELVAPPPAAEQERIGKEIHELFAAELGAASSERRRAAAQKLIDESDRKTIDDATRFVLLSDARDIALAGGDFQESWNAVSELEEHFTVDGPAMKLELLQRFRKGKGSTDSARVASNCALELASEYAAVDKYPDAERALSLADALAAQSRDRYAIDLAKKRANEIRWTESRYRSAMTALKALTNNHKDPDANLTVGQFYCFAKHEWPRGLPYLSRGADHTLAKLASEDLGAPATGAAQLNLANEWWTAAERSPEPIKSSMILRALEWYGRAQAGLTGLQQEIATKRIAQGTQLVGASQAAPHRVVDLMRYVDLKADAIEGDWAREGTGIKSTGRANAKLIIPYEPPAEYDFTVVYTRLGGHDQVAQIFPVSDSELAWSVGSWGKTMALAADGKALWSGEDPHCTDTGKEYTSVVKVRRAGIEITFNGRKVAEYTGPLSGLSAPRESKLPNAKALGLLTWYGTSQRFSKMELTEITGTGHVLTNAP